MSEKTNKQKSECMFCGAHVYGGGCPYSPHRKHVHTDEPTKCIYCGMSSFGIGCPYNPFSRAHVHGSEYNSMIKENAYETFVSSLFLHRLSQPITETAAYQKGLVDKNGCKIRDPETLEEKAALTPLDQYIFKVRRFIGPDKIELLNSSVVLEKMSHESKAFNSSDYEQECKIRNRIHHLMEELLKTIAEGNESGITRSGLDGMVIEALLLPKDKENPS